jgi:hypothetical protein
MKNTFSGWFVRGWYIVLSGTKKEGIPWSESLPLRQKAHVMENVSQNESRFLSVPLDRVTTSERLGQCK